MTKKDENKYNRIIKESFWDYNFSIDELQNICESDDFRNKKFIFDKILKNSTDILNDIKIFTENDRINLLKSFKISNFNYDFINRRFKILKRLILKEDVEILELSWTK
jgi:hypothetical protein